jgi:hypothetical protein
MAKGRMAASGMLVNVLLVLGIISLVAFLGVNYLGVKIPTMGASVTGGQPFSVTSQSCANTNGKGTLNYVARAPGNSSLNYPAVSYVVKYLSPDYLKGQVAGTGSAAVAATKTWDADANNVECLSEIEVITLGSSGISGRLDKVPGVMQTNSYLEVEQPTYKAANVRIYDSAYTNITTSVDATTSSTSAQTVGSGGRLDTIVRVMPQANTVVGNYQNNEMLVVFDLIDNTKFSTTNGVTISGIPGVVPVSATAVPSPYGAYSVAAGKSVPVAFKVPALSSGSIIGWNGMSGNQDIKVALYADLGDPGSTTDVVMYLLTPGWFQDTDGNYKYGVYNAAGTLSIGAANTVTYDLA